MTSITHTGPSGTLMSLAYTYDAAGNRTSVTKDGGNPETYTLDALNRLTGVTYADGTTQAYTYDANGNRLSLTVNGGTPTTYTYNDGDQLTSDGTSTYTYDANGNLVARGSDTFTWDYASRMTGATVGGTTASYAYDGEDIRVGGNIAGMPTVYTWDRHTGLPLFPNEGTNVGEVPVTENSYAPYLSEDDVSPLELPLLVGVDGEALLFEDDALLAVVDTAARDDLVLDALQSPRGAADASGLLASAQNFEVFGTTSGPPLAPIGFQGAVSDPVSGLLFLTSRYWDPKTGRFMSADPVRPNAVGTQGYNSYACVANNPTTWRDPSGNTTAEYAEQNRENARVTPSLRCLGKAIANALAQVACAFDPYCLDIMKYVLFAQKGKQNKRLTGCQEMTPAKKVTKEKVEERVRNKQKRKNKKQGRGGGGGMR